MTANIVLTGRLTKRQGQLPRQEKFASLLLGFIKGIIDALFKW